MARIEGLGGIFFKCHNPGALAAWYRDVMGFDIEEWGGARFLQRDFQPPHAPNYQVWGPFPPDTVYFMPSMREFMVNLRVDDLDGVLAMLAERGVPVLGRNDEDPNGRFAWIVDPEGTKIELWEPRKESGAGD